MHNDKFTHYVILLNRVEGRAFTPEIIRQHIEHLAALDNEGVLVMCGPFTDFPAGMLIVKAANKQEAVAIAESDPFVVQGFSHFEVRTWLLACRENGYLGT